MHLLTRRRNICRLKLVEATLAEIEGRAEGVDEEVQRMRQLGSTYQLDSLQAAAKHRQASLLHIGAGDGEAAAAAAPAGPRISCNAWGECDACRTGAPNMRCRCGAAWNKWQGTACSAGLVGCSHNPAPLRTASTATASAGCTHCAARQPH